jgi:hypothetical protein
MRRSGSTVSMSLVASTQNVTSIDVIYVLDSPAASAKPHRRVALHRVA